MTIASSIALVNQNIIAPTIPNAKRRNKSNSHVLLTVNAGLNTAKLISVLRRTMEKCAPVTSNANQSLVQAGSVKGRTMEKRAPVISNANQTFAQADSVRATSLLQ